jgi:hypothetical protein
MGETVNAKPAIKSSRSFILEARHFWPDFNSFSGLRELGANDRDGEDEGGEPLAANGGTPK